MCERCGRGVAESSYLCQTCVNGWTTALRAAAGIAAAADSYRARVGTSWRFGSGGRSAATALPYDPRVTPAVEQLVKAVDWAPRRPEWWSVPRRVLAASTLTGLMAGHPQAARRAEMAHAALGRLIRIVDSPPEQVYFGPCGTCQESLYVDASSAGATLVCGRCGATHDAAERRAELVEAMMGYLATAYEISRLLRAITGEKLVSQQSIGRLVERGRLVARGTRTSRDLLGRSRTAATYRIGDVLDLVSGANMGYAARDTRVLSA